MMGVGTWPSDDLEPFLSTLQRRLMALIQNQPGINLSDAAKRFGVTRQAIEYHAHRLGRVGLLVEQRIGRRTALFPADQLETGANRILGLLRSRTVAAIVESLKADPSMSWHRLSQRLNITRAAVRWHVERLERDGILHVRRSPNGQRHVVEWNDELSAILDESEP